MEKLIKYYCKKDKLPQPLKSEVQILYSATIPISKNPKSNKPKQNVKK